MKVVASPVLVAIAQQLVWIVDPHFKTVTIHRNDSAPQLFNIEQQISGEPFLLGLAFAVKELFG